MSVMDGGLPPVGAMPSMMEPSVSAGQETPLGEEYRSIIDHVMSVMGSERDEVDKAELAKVVALLQKILARNQVDAERALGDQGLGRLMRKAGGGY